MVNSHYIPQFILKSFCTDNKLYYCDIDKKNVEARNTRSVFSEKGYYPDDIEKDLSKKVEYEFSVLYHNKLEKLSNTIDLNERELFILKKYLVVSALRFRYEYSDLDLEIIEELGDSYKLRIIDSLNKILKAESTEDYKDIIKSVGGDTVFNMLSGNKIDDETINMHLWSESKDIIQSYLVFVRAPRDEKFIIPDTGRGVYEGPLGIKKLTGLIDYTMMHPDPRLWTLISTISPRDYSVYPLTKDLAVLTMNGFFKLVTDSEFDINVTLPEECPTVSSVLGFGSKEVINPPKVRFNGINKVYKYTVNRINSNDISHLNCLMMAQAKHFIAFNNPNEIKRSVELIDEYTDRSFDFIKTKT